MTENATIFLLLKPFSIFVSNIIVDYVFLYSFPSNTKARVFVFVCLFFELYKSFFIVSSWVRTPKYLLHFSGNHFHFFPLYLILLGLDRLKLIQSGYILILCIWNACFFCIMSLKWKCPVKSLSSQRRIFPGIFSFISLQFFGEIFSFPYFILPFSFHIFLFCYFIFFFLFLSFLFLLFFLYSFTLFSFASFFFNFRLHSFIFFKILYFLLFHCFLLYSYFISISFFSSFYSLTNHFFHFLFLKILLMFFFVFLILFDVFNPRLWRLFISFYCFHLSFNWACGIFLSYFWLSF